MRFVCDLTVLKNLAQGSCDLAFFSGTVTELVLITGELADVDEGNLALAYILNIILGWF